MPRALIIVCAAMLVIAVAPMPYGYYTLVRLVTCVTLLIGARVAHTRGARSLPTVLGVAALLFNPVIPVHLTKTAWGVIDLSTAALLIGQLAFLSQPRLPAQN